MQAKEGFRRAGLVLFNLTYGTTINIVKSTILIGISGAYSFSDKAWEHSIPGKIFSPILGAVGFVVGALYGIACGIYDIFKNFVNIIRDGNYQSYTNIKEIPLEFKYNEQISKELYNELKVKSPWQIFKKTIEGTTVTPDATPNVEYYRAHTMSL